MQDVSFLVPFLIGGIVIAFVVFMFAMRRLKRRAQAAQSFAAQHGFRYEGDVNPFPGLTLNGPEPAAGGGARPIAPNVVMDLAARTGTIRNVLRGTTAAGEAILFDYRAAGINDEGLRTSGPHTTFAAFRVPDIPDLKVWPQGRFSFGIKDIDFPACPRFSKRFTLTGNEEAAVRKLFSSAVLEACEALSEKRKWSLEGGSGWLLVSFGEEGQWQELVEQGARVAAAMQ